MSDKLLGKNVRKSCAWCVHGVKSEYSDEVFCIKNGVTLINDYCRKYKYDPLKRIPDRKKIAGKFSAEDFKL